MNWDLIQGNWKQLVGITRAQWGLLLDDEQCVVAGRLYQLDGQAQQCYGLARVEADRQLAQSSQVHDAAWSTKARGGTR
jgi:uncharacterized protein YjbJ (UPF0337 family)